MKVQFKEYFKLSSNQNSLVHQAKEKKKTEKRSDLNGPREDLKSGNRALCSPPSVPAAGDQQKAEGVRLVSIQSPAYLLGWTATIVTLSYV